MALLHSHTVIDKAKNEIQKAVLLRYAISTKKVSVKAKKRLKGSGS